MLTILSLLDPRLALWSSVLHPLCGAVPQQRDQAKACILWVGDSQESENKRAKSLFSWRRHLGLNLALLKLKSKE